MNANSNASLEREREIFLEALDEPAPSERAAFLDGACGEDEEPKLKLFNTDKLQITKKTKL